MNRVEARYALSKGSKLTHAYFSCDEWVKQCGLMYVFEDGCKCDPEQFWLDRDDDGFDFGWRKYINE